MEGGQGGASSSLLLSHFYACLTKQTPDSRCRSLNLVQTTPASRTATCYFAASRPTNQTPLSATPPDLHDAGNLPPLPPLLPPQLQYLHSSHQKDKPPTDAINSSAALCSLRSPVLFARPPAVDRFVNPCSGSESAAVRSSCSAPSLRVVKLFLDATTRVLL